MVYFGYIHECAELYRQLCRDSRTEWNSKSKSIIKVIMKHKESRFRMQFKRPFMKRNAEFLLKNEIYNYFSIGILGKICPIILIRSLNSLTFCLVDGIESYEAAIYFMEKLGEHASFLFYDFQLIVRNPTFESAQNLIKMYWNFKRI